MEDTHITELLAAYADGECTPAELAEVEAHLASCAACRTGLDEVQLGRRAMATMPLATAPDSIWTGIEKELARRAKRRLTMRYLAAAAALVMVTAAVWQIRRSVAPRWEVTGIPGMVSAGVGEWIETGGQTGATVKIGVIGVVDVEADSRVRILRAGAGEQRLALERGRIHAKITAPPRLFSVDTRAGTAVDLGCEYDLACDRDGNGLLRVQQGWVSYEREGAESLVPAGASCRTRAGRAPATPYFDDAPAAFLEALTKFDAGDGGLDTLLASARGRDTLTLWHLLSRVANDGERALVFSRMVSFAALPAGVSRERILSLDRESLRRWREELAWTW